MLSFYERKAATYNKNVAFIEWENVFIKQWEGCLNKELCKYKVWVFMF